MRCYHDSNVKYCFVLMLLLCRAGLTQVCAPTLAIQPNSVISAALTASNCTLADGSSYADYLVAFPTQGTWSGSVTAADGVTPLTLILRDLSGAQLYSGATLQGSVERGTYHILVNAAAPGQATGYQLSSSFAAAPNVLCWNYAMLGTIRPIAGSLGPASCALPDGSSYDGFQLTLYGSGTVDIAVTANGFTPLLILRTSDGYSLPGGTSVDANGATHLTVQSVGDDTYTVIVAMSSPGQAGGAYSVLASFTPNQGETCVPQAGLDGSQQTSGTITATSCNFNLPNRDDNALFNFYNVHLDQAGVVQAAIASADFSPLLLLLDADGNAIAEDIESGGNGAPLIQQQLPAGDYLLVVFNEDSFGGSYSLTYRYTPGTGNPCPVITVNPGDQVSGILAGASSCSDFGYLADTYQVVLPVAGTLTLLLSSPDFSTFLDLHDAKDNDLTWGAPTPDDSGSVITVNLPAGTYYTYAASMDLPGGYSLSYTFAPSSLPACPVARTMAPNAYIQNAQLGPASCQGTDGRFADFYSFTLPVASTQAVFMLSQAIPPYITLYRSDGTPLRSDQHSYANDNAAIIQYLPAGNYLVKARSSDPNATGPYSLYLDFQQGSPPQLCAPLSLPVNGFVTGQTWFTSCTWYDKTFSDVYQLNITSSQLVTIGVQSTDFDAFLILMDAKGNLLTSDDNSGGGLNPLIVQSLDPGVYYVVVKPSSDPTTSGNYTISEVSSPVSTAQALPAREKF